VKFKDLDTGIQCDLNINDQLGSINTSLVQHYCDTLPVLRPLLLAIKRWARPLGYNNPAGALGVPMTFSSYTLTIMTIGLLQVMCIAWLP
jgi:DNA polymerase sigma